MPYRFMSIFSILQNSYLSCCICCIVWFHFQEVDFITASCKNWVAHKTFMWEFQECKFDKTTLVSEISNKG